MIYYLFAIMDNICCAFTILFILSSIFIGVTLVISILEYFDDFKEEDQRGIKLLKKWITPYIILILLVIFIPSQKQLAFILVAPHIVENKDIQETFKNIPEIAKLGAEYLKEVLNDKNKVGE